MRSSTMLSNARLHSSQLYITPRLITDNDIAAGHYLRINLKSSAGNQHVQGFTLLLILQLTAGIS